jgi:hypothetical protein
MRRSASVGLQEIWRNALPGEYIAYYGRDTQVTIEPVWYTRSARVDAIVRITSLDAGRNESTERQSREQIDRDFVDFIADQEQRLFELGLDPQAGGVAVHFPRRLPPPQPA